MKVRITQDTRNALSLYGPFWEVHTEALNWPTHKGAAEWLDAIHDKTDLFAELHTLHISEGMVECAHLLDQQLDWYATINRHVEETWSRCEAEQVRRDLSTLRRALMCHQ
jgi:hypothetical protein